MATYYIDNLPSKFNIDDIILCPYSGTEKSITLPKGTFLLECWGGHGHWDSATSTYISYGGYSNGRYTTSTETIIYLNCGGNGLNNSSTAAYNGGGVCVSARGHNGGGATHIGLKSGLLTTFKNDYASKLLMVAGGSGGCASDRRDAKGGAGGGTSGGDGTTSVGAKYYGTGGTQNSGGSGATGYSEATDGTFGQGGTGYKSSGSGYPGAGGGGFYGGGGGAAASGGLFTTDYNGAGGGGSGYISSLLENATTAQESTSSNPDTEDHAGYIKITVIEVAYTIRYLVFYGDGSAIIQDTSDDDIIVSYDGRTILTINSIDPPVRKLLCANKLMKSNINIANHVIPCKDKLMRNNIQITLRYL